MNMVKKPPNYRCHDTNRKLWPKCVTGAIYIRCADCIYYKQVNEHD